MRPALRFLLVCAPFAFAACTAIQTVQPADLSPPNPPTRVWVTRADHTAVVFDSARVRGDSLVGVVNGQVERLPLSEATVLRVSEPSPDRTAELVFVGATAALLAWIHLSNNTSTGPFVCVADCPLGTECCRSGCCAV